MRSLRISYLLFLIPGLLSGQAGKQPETPEVSIPLQAKSNGTPTYPFPVTVQQPDGSEIRLKGRGDRMIHWYETEAGYTVLQDKKGNFVYGERDADGNLVPGSLVVGKDEQFLDDGDKHLSFLAGQVETLGSAYADYPRTKANPNPFPASGTNDVLVIMVDFPDLPATISQAEFNDLMNEPNYNGTGSFRDYYLEVSYNNLTLESTVVPWVTASQNMSYYGDNDALGYDLRPQELVREALDLVEARGFDFSQFDNDGDGYVDEIVLVHAGYGEQFPGAGDSTIWSHAFHLADLAVEYDGVILDNYIACPELFGNSGASINTVGTVVHEFAHSLGIPDLYDIDYYGSGGYAFDLNFWDLMAVGSWNDLGVSPAGINAWLKNYMGWMTIPVIDTTGTFTLNPASELPEAFRLNTPVYNEYFILENRQQTGFDRGLPGNGMLVYHVDLNYPGWLTGDINVDPTHQGFDLEEADDIRDTVSLAGDPFPGTSNNTRFDSTSVPPSFTWDGNNSNVAISGIASADGVISFEIEETTLSQLPDGWDVEELQYTQQGTLIGEVMIGTETVSHGYLGVFVDTVCRGIASASFYEGSARFIFDATVFSNAASGDLLQFRYYDPDLDSVFHLYETLTFINDTIAGSLDDPFTFHTPVQFTKDFVEGWNWFSMNVKMNNMSPAGVFTTCASAGDYVKNQRVSSTYYAGYGWFGTMSALNNTDLYQIKAAASCGIQAEGVAVDPQNTPIDLVAGWNWVSYSPQVPLSPDEALASLTPASLDYIKNQRVSATYYEGYGWYGTLNQMQPGDGYMMKMAGADQLVYPSATAKKSRVITPGKNKHFPEFNPAKYPFNGSITASVSMDGMSMYAEDDVLSAWVDGECRGAVSGLYFDPAGDVRFPLMIHGEDRAEQVTFRYFHAASGKTYNCDQQLAFEKNMVAGDAFRPVELSISTQDLGLSEVQPESAGFTVYPNPVSEILTIGFIITATSEIEIEVYDIYGKLVDVLTHREYPPGSHAIRWELPDKPHSAYMIRLNDGHASQFKRVIHID